MYCWLLAALPLWAQPAPAVAAPSPTNQPLNVTAERIDHLQEQDIYEADGSVVITQGPFKLTADHVTIKSLPGTLIATGHVHLVDPTSDIRSDQLELNVNTEAGVVTTGSLYVKLSNSYLAGRLLQRMSEDHYRIKDGTFTNCDAGEGETPAWRFKFEDLDVRTGESVAMKRGWLCMNDARILPIPTLTYPLNNRHSGFLIPTPGYDNRFGLHYQQGYFWAINPSQDMTISPSYYSNLGYGSDFAYRYYLDRRSRGEWFASVLQQTKLPNVSGVDQAGGGEQRLRGIFSGTHVQQVTDTLLIRGQASFVSDRTYLQQLSNSGAQRASPSGESSLLATQRLPYGNAYLLGQFLQPLNFGGPDTFQRLPEVGYVLPNTSPFGLPFLVNMDTNFVNFFREQGFGVNRMDFTPGLATDVIDVGHLVGFTPQFKFKEVYYTRGIESSDAIHRETFWASLDATSKLSRRYTGSEGGSLLHTIEPSVMYEYVPGSDQSKIAQIDQIDDLPKKNLLTYALRSRLLEQQINGQSFNWLDLTLAQSYHVGAVQTRAREFTPGILPFLGSLTQPLQPATVAVQGRKMSDLWMRAVIGNTAPDFLNPPGSQQTLTRNQTGGQMLPPTNSYLTVDAFLDPYRGTFSQWNTDLRVQQSNYWYAEIGQRFSRDGNRVRRGDIWNPISFNEVYAPTAEVQFVTAGAGFRTPWGWTFGAKGYYDVKGGRSPEYDVVALYQNPCKCWSLGLYYLQFPDRQSYSFMLSMTGIGWTENFGTIVVRSILSPLMIGDRGLPWAAPGGPYGRAQSVVPTQSMPTGRY
ncbi:MAG: LPS-assembly protein LptD [Nitrospiraceae bacterium]|nr:LPS-assembly protein LptD [Nitrospiraceae bacterium]